jgi:signal transduction histidine kinase/PAS domain-containing protein
MRNRHPTINLAPCLAAALLLLGLALAGVWCATAFAEEPGTPPSLNVTTVDAQTSLAPYLAYLRDPSGRLTLANVEAPSTAARFAAFGDAFPNLGPTSDAIWVRLALTNPLTETVPLVLHLDSPTTGYVDIYSGLPASDRQPVVATGALSPYESRPIPGRAFAIPLDIPAGKTSSYYWRLQSDFPINLSASLWQPLAFAAAADRDEVSWGIVLGMLVLMSAYNLLLYITLRDPMHLMLVAFGLLVVVSTAVSGGYTSRWVPAQFAGWHALWMIVSVALVLAAFVLLALTFLELRSHLRPAYWILLGSLGTAGMAVLIAAFGSYRLGYTILLGVLLPVLVTIFVATLMRIRQGSRLALFLLLGQLVAIVFGLVQSLSLLGFGPKVPTPQLVVPCSSLFLQVIMSLALADRVNVLRREADKANAAIKDSEERLKVYLDALPFQVQVHDPQLTPLYVNASIRQNPYNMPDGWYDQQYDAWLRDFPVVVSGTDQPYPLEQLPLIRSARGEPAHADDIAIQTPRGQVTIESWSTPLRDQAGNITAIVSAFHDISKRRANEIELAGYRETLEQRVAQRTSELAALNTSLGARVTELTAINEVGRRVAHLTKMEATLGEVVQVLAQVFQVTLAAVCLFDDERHMVQVVAMSDGSSSVPSRMVGSSFFYDPAYGLPIQQVSPTIIRNPAQLPGLPEDICGSLARHGIKQLLAAPLVARNQIIGALALLVDDRDRVFAADDLRVAQTIAGQVATAIDTVRLIDEVRRQRDVAEALRQTATALSRNLDQQNVLGAILEQLDQVFACEGAAVSLVDGKELVTVAAKGLSAGCLGMRIPLDSVDAGLSVLRSKRPSIVADTRCSAEPVCCTATQPIRSWLGVPLLSGEDAIGVLNLDSVEVGSFSPAQAELLATFADQAAVAVVNARLYNQAQITAVAGERNRLARDLHDAVTQTIFSASLVAATLPARLPELSPAAKADMEMLQVLTKGALAEMRTLLLELRPEHLQEVQLDVLLTQLAQAFSGRTGVPASVHATCDEGFAPPYAVKIAFYRVAQEALNNVAKHAKATCVTIHCSMHGSSRDSSQASSIRLAVIDDGKGFAGDSVGPEKLGLAIMRERAAAVGAQLTVDSELRLGTHVFMVWNDENNTQAA